MPDVADLGFMASRMSALVRTIAAHVVLWDRATSQDIMTAVWRYCPNCYTLADSNSLLRRCPKCPGIPNNHLRVLPLPPEAAQAAVRIGGQQALILMIVSLIGGDEAHDAIAVHHADCAYTLKGYCDMYCLQGGPPIEDPDL